MEWTALTREALEEMISKALQAMDDVVQNDWEAMCIKPEKWRCSPWGDRGGGFWAVALRGDHVVWYNDIEEGFNVSRFTQRGMIDEYAGSQLSFEQFLLSLPAAQKTAHWAEGTVVPPELEGGGIIVRRQTTYWEVGSDNGSLWRLHFKAKAETRFVEARFSRMELRAEHPLLDQYLEPWAQLFFTGTPINPVTVKNMLAEQVVAASRGWRSLEEYINGAVDLRKGYGLLMRAPKALVETAACFLMEMGIAPSVLDIPGLPTHPHALIMDRSAIVAQAFRFEARGAA